jgi:PP-loop superfamily ATP-utilizing enzyme
MVVPSFGQHNFIIQQKQKCSESATRESHRCYICHLQIKTCIYLAPND